MFYCIVMLLRPNFHVDMKNRQFGPLFHQAEWICKKYFAHKHHEPEDFCWCENLNFLGENGGMRLWITKWTFKAMGAKSDYTFLTLNRWEIGHWSQCSKTCGQGYHYRTVHCWRMIQPGLDSSVSNDLCDGTPRPTDMKPCEGLVSCGPQWQTSEWSEVSGERDLWEGEVYDIIGLRWKCLGWLVWWYRKTNSPSKWLRNSLVTGSCTFHNNDEGHRICMVITLIVVEDSKAWSSWHGDNPITCNTLTANRFETLWKVRIMQTTMTDIWMVRDEWEEDVGMGQGCMLILGLDGSILK